MLLLDQLLKFPELKLIGCCNELNAGYVWVFSDDVCGIQEGMYG